MKFIKLESIYGGSFCINIKDIIFIEQYNKSSNYAKIHIRHLNDHECWLISKESPEEVYEMLVKLTK